MNCFHKTHHRLARTGYGFQSATCPPHAEYPGSLGEKGYSEYAYQRMLISWRLGRVLDAKIGM